MQDVECFCCPRETRFPCLQLWKPILPRMMFCWTRPPGDERHIETDRKALIVKREFSIAVYKLITRDGGMIWEYPLEIDSHHEGHPCEAGLVRSPDGKRIAMLMRKNVRKWNSCICFSDVECQS